MQNQLVALKENCVPQENSNKVPPHEVAARVMTDVESAFGYQVGDSSIRGHLSSKWQSEAEDDSFEELFGFFIAMSVNWSAEVQAGPRPEEAASAAMQKRLDDDVPDRPLDPEKPEVVARHFCGLLAIDMIVLPRPARYWVADLNVPLVFNKPAPIYLWGEGALPQGAVFESVTAKAAFRKEWRALQNADAMEDEAAVKKSAAALLARHGRAFALEYPRWVKDKPTLPAELRNLELDPAFADPAGERLWAAYRAFLPVGRVLTERAVGHPSTMLTPAEASALAIVSRDVDHDHWPPALLARLFAPALSGDKVGAEAAAKFIVDNKLGVPLTQRWAELVIKNEAPIAVR